MTNREVKQYPKSPDVPRQHLIVSFRSVETTDRRISMSRFYIKAGRRPI